MLEPPQLPSGLQLASDDERRLDSQRERATTGKVADIHDRLVCSPAGEETARHLLARQRIAPARLSGVLLDAGLGVVASSPPPVGFPLRVPCSLEQR